ncbi:preprotein translocase subunit YajC [Brevibacterium rongguiense]|nr:preprotein translocase subunit YajC [Brevibacterium rongguiense]
MDPTLIFIVAIGAMLIFFMFNSRKKQKARAEQISNNMVPGARVMTSFGLFGTVTEVSDDGLKVTIESGPGTTLVVHRQAIGQIEPPESEAVAGGVDLGKDDAAVQEAPAGSSAAGASAAGEREPVSADAEDDADESGRITDAELDAMNAERARRGAAGDDESDDQGRAAGAGKGADAGDGETEPATTAGEHTADEHAESQVTGTEGAQAGESATADSEDVDEAPGTELPENRTDHLTPADRSLSTDASEPKPALQTDDESDAETPARVDDDGEHGARASAADAEQEAPEAAAEAAEKTTDADHASDRDAEPGVGDDPEAGPAKR